MKLVNIGFGNCVAAHRVRSVTAVDSAPIKQLIADARKTNQLIDATYGRRTRSVLIFDSGHVLLSALQPATVTARFSQQKRR